MKKREREGEIKGMFICREMFFIFYFLFFYFYFYLFIYLFIYLFLAVLGLRFCVRAFSSCGKRGPLFIAVHGPLTIAASFVADHRLQMRRLSSSGSRARLLCGMWALPRPGLEPVSPALAGGPPTTAPPGKPGKCFLNDGTSTSWNIMQPLYKLNRSTPADLEDFYTLLMSEKS